MASMLIVFGIMLGLTSVLEEGKAQELPTPYQYQGNPPDLEEVNIYFVPHSHTDPGWIETIQKYYDREVRDILYNVVMELSHDASKRFTWAETCYLKQFYDEMKANSDEMRDRIVEVVESGQLELVGGGWVQHDETLSTYRQQITNMQAGWEWIKDTFPNIKKAPEVFWQIDPFGASPITPLLINNQSSIPFLRYKYQVLNRIGDLAKEKLKATLSMDFYAKHNSSTYNDSALLTHVLHGHYDTSGHDLLQKIYEADFLYQKPGMREYLQEYADKVIISQVKDQRHNNLMLLIGSDFAFITKAVRPNQKEVSTFKVMDRVIRILNEEGERYLGFKVRAKYATPSEYFKKLSKVEDIPTHYNPDFSHYDEHFHLLHPEFKGLDRVDYWTGYYSNRPSLKTLIYRAFSYYHSASTFSLLSHLHATPTLSSLLPLSSNQTHPSLDPDSLSAARLGHLTHQLSALAHSVSIGVHHDTLPSTSRANVHEQETDRFKQVIEDSSQLIVKEYTSLFQGRQRERGDVRQYMVANDGAARRQVIRLQVRGECQSVRVWVGGQEVLADVVPMFTCSYQHGQKDKVVNQVIIPMQLAPMSVNVVEIREFKSFTECKASSEDGAKCSKFIDHQYVLAKALQMSNSQINLGFDSKSMLLNFIHLKNQNLNIDLDLSLIRYSGANSESGAYIFAPTSPGKKMAIKPIDAYYVESSIQSQVLIFYKTIYKSSCFGVLTVSLDHFGDYQHMPHIRFRTFPVDHDDLFFRIRVKDQQRATLKVHNSLYFKQVEISEKRYLSERDLGINFHPCVSGAQLEFENFTLQLNTGERPTGVGQVDDGAIDIGLGRKNNYDDDKGLPDGVLDNQPWHLTFSLSVFQSGIYSSYKKDLDLYSKPLVITHLEKVYDFERNSISFQYLLPTFGEVIAVFFRNGKYQALIKTQNQTEMSIELVELNHRTEVTSLLSRREELMYKHRMPMCYVDNR